MEIVTYSLRGSSQNPDEYYQTVRQFAQKLMNQALSEFSGTLQGFMNYLADSGTEELRANEEYAFELIMMGVFRRIYSREAAGMSGYLYRILNWLTLLRNNNQFLKPLADRLRGLIFTISARRGAEAKINYSIPDLNKLIGWMSAAGEFSQEGKRLAHIRDYLATLPFREAEELMKKTDIFSIRFEDEARSVLGKYTSRVHAYLSGDYLRHKFREDYLFCGRHETEYHLNMVGAEVLNKAYRADFMRRPRKGVFIPACMCRRPGNQCKRVKSDLGYVCSGCTQECGVRELDKVCGKLDAQLYIIPHESDLFTKGAESAVVRRDLGVVGVACVLNLLSGGWKVRAIGIPAQCVLLDYCGCKAHWDKKGQVTRININRLVDILSGK